MSIGIYKIKNLINEKVYIGQLVHIEKRWQEHCRTTKSLIGQAINKYGKSNFSFEILEEVSNIKELNNRESYYIQKYDCLAPKGYNIKIEDDQQHHQFNKYNHEEFLEIIDEIKNSTLSFKQIAENHGLDLSTIYYLNRGDYQSLPNEKYPLREVADLSKKHYYCIDCGCEIYKKATRCSKCDHLHQRVVERPDRNELKKLIRNNSFTSIGRMYGVTDGAIRKWCKTENLPYKVSEIKKYSDSEWQEI